MAEIETRVASIEVAGRPRSYTQVRRANLRAGAPLLLVFHGSNQSGQKLREFSGHVFDELAEREGVIVVYPDGHRGHWNDARVQSDFAARAEGYDDVAFARALIDLYVDSGAADAGRVYAAGYSNGGQLVIRLLQEIPHLLGGVGLISATMPAPENLLPAVSVAPVPVLLIHGTKDPIVPYRGGMASLWGFRPRGLGISLVATAQAFAARNGITAAPTARELPSTTPGSTSARVIEFAQANTPPVRAITVVGGGHTIPNPTASAPRIMGRTHQGFDTARELWAFLTSAKPSV
jgi:polyhydroxybutyrate depolymerase